MITIKVALITIKEVMITIIEPMITIKEAMITIKEALITIIVAMITIKVALITIKEAMITIKMEGIPAFYAKLRIWQLLPGAFVTISTTRVVHHAIGAWNLLTPCLEIQIGIHQSQNGIHQL